MRLTWFVALGVAAVGACALLASCNDDDNDDVTRTETPTRARSTATPGADATSTPGLIGADDELEIDLTGLNNFDKKGTATIREGVVPGSTAIVVQMEDTDGLGSVGLHTGTCKDYDEDAISEIGDFSEVPGVLENGLQAELSSMPLTELRGEDHVVVVMDEGGIQAVACGDITTT